MHLVIDADSALYRAGFANEKREYACSIEGEYITGFQYKKEADEFQEDTGCDVELVSIPGPVGLSLHNLRQSVASMFAIEHSSYEMYFEGEGNFRYNYFPEYKSARKNSPKPAHFEQLKKHLQGQYGAIPVEKEETDDRVSWRHLQLLSEGKESCIVSIDKDLNNTYGWHYNWVSGDLYYISLEEADLNFWRQLITGDVTDSVPGIPGAGKKAAEKILPYWREHGLELVKHAYADAGLSDEYFLSQARCLYIRRKPEEIFGE